MSILNLHHSKWRLSQPHCLRSSCCHSKHCIFLWPQDSLHPVVWEVEITDVLIWRFCSPLPRAGPWWEGRAGTCPLHWGLKEIWIMMNGEFLMAPLLSSSSKYCSTISTLDYSKQWHNYVIFPGSLVLFLWGLKSVSPVKGLIKPHCSWIRAADLVFIAAVLNKLFWSTLAFFCILLESLMLKIE